MPVNELQQWELSVRDYRKTACDLDDSSSMDRRLAKSSICRTMNHPFHIHSTHFQISDMNDDTDPDEILFGVGDWRDTLPLYHGGVQIRFTPRKYMVGNVFTHCHIASHVDAGMAQLVNVYDPRTGDGEEIGSSNLESDADEDDGDAEDEANEIDEVDESESDDTEEDRR